MNVIFVAGMLAGMVAIVGRVMILRARERGARRAAESVGLTDLTWTQRPSAGDPLVQGRSGELYVSLETYSGDADEGTKIVVNGPEHEAGTLSLFREDGLETRQKRAGGEREVETGDPSFDQEFFVQAPAPLALAVLGPETRRLVRVLMRSRLLATAGKTVMLQTSLRSGVLEVRLPDGGFSGKVARAERAPEVLPRVLDLAHRLVAPPDLAARIAENVRTEPEAGVRRRCLATLAREFPDHPATRQALLGGLQDPDAEVRVRAAIAAGPEGRPVLAAVAAGEDAPDDASARAVAGLAAGLSAEEATDLLEGALRVRRVATACACLRVLGRRGASAIPTIAKVLAVERSPEVAAAAADALGATGDPSAEAALVSALASPHEPVRLAAAKALGHVGTAAAVVPLRALESEDVGLRRAARQAIGRIQWRATGAEPGQLSMAGGEAGQLSMADGAHGQLSLANEATDGGSFASGQTGVAQDDGAEPSRPGQRKSLGTTG